MVGEPRAFSEGPDERLLDPCDEDQVRAWALRYSVEPDEIRRACEVAGAHRVAVELWLGEARL
jgi:hypothetical protein